MSERKPVIGICGGIGAGKSLVARVFEELGALRIDSDGLGREILCRKDVIETLREWFGEKLVSADGGIDRGELASIIFGQQELKQRVESLLHPLIAARRADIIKACSDDPKVRAIILDSPLLIESNLDRQCDALVFVEASESRRLQRLQQSRGWDTQELQRRQRWQMPLADKRARCQYTVSNDGTIEELRNQAKFVFDQIVRDNASDE